MSEETLDNLDANDSHYASESSMDSMSEASLELASRLITRLKPDDRHSIFKMIANKAYFSGGLMTIILVFWWLTVDSASDDLDTGVSTFFGLDFSQVALTVMALGLVSSLLRDFSRELGQLTPALISGALIILCCLYVFEPLAVGILTEEFSTSNGIWRTIRLGLLWIGVTFCAHLLVDASLLAWLKRFCDSKGFEIEPLAERNNRQGEILGND